LRIVPKKIRDFKKRLRQAGYVERPGKGSHEIWDHPLLIEHIVVSY
jgi:predicted RNA binding protein YcfA (HicA-like mRNA interferase family)